MASAKDFSEAGFQFLGRSYEEMDCQRFVELCLRSVGIIKDLAGSNAWYREMTWVGTPEDCMRTFGSIPVGAMLFILESDGNEPQKYKSDGIGNASHIGIKTARQKGAIHSSSSRGCVFESDFHDKTIPHGGWNRVGLWKALSYGEEIDNMLGSDPVESDSAVIGKVVRSSSAKPNTTTVNLRAGASTATATIEKIPFGDIVEIIEDKGQWMYVKHGNKTGFIMADFIEYGGGDTETDNVDARSIIAEIREMLNKLENMIGKG